MTLPRFEAKEIAPIVIFVGYSTLENSVIKTTLCPHGHILAVTGARGNEAGLLVYNHVIVI
jgi:hypothetical protein